MTATRPAESQMDTAIRQAIADVVAGRDLAEDRAHAVAGSMMTGEATPAQIAALLVALRMKGETVDEITGFARAMREKARTIPGDTDGVIDTCGTGGDGSGTFNISTVSAFVVAGAGVAVAKHGNRSVSSKCGSAELLEQLGVPVDADADQAARNLKTAGFAFLFAPLYHEATRHAVGPRREIGVRSLFNLVGPLTNPAGARRQLMGVFDGAFTEPLAQVLGRLGSVHCMVVHGSDGLDEITLSGPTLVSEFRDGTLRSYDLDPREFGFELRGLDEVQGATPSTNARIAEEILAGEPGAPREIVLLNAGAAIHVGGAAASIAEGIAAARRSIDSGAALRRLRILQGRGA